MSDEPKAAVHKADEHKAAAPPPVDKGIPEAVKAWLVEKSVIPPEKRKKSPETLHEKVTDLSERLDGAAGTRDADAIEGCYKDLDALKPSKPDEEQAYLALSRRFSHYAPRQASKVKAIEHGLDAGLKAKDLPKEKIEHPAVTQAKAALVSLEAQHAGHVVLPEDAKAIEALKAKIEVVPPIDDK